MNGKLTLGLVTILVMPAWPSAQERHTHPAGKDAPALGSVSFANSGNRAAQTPFLRGLALLHSFEYEEAAEAFRSAQQTDPSFAMAFWAEALTYSHLLWGEDDANAARQALRRLASSRDARLSKASTPRERAYGVAVEALFADTKLPERVRGFAAEMRRVSSTYADDLEAAAFTSLALMFAAKTGDLPPDQRGAAREDAVTFAQRVFTTDPQHPGGAHYLIHSTDDPELAPRGLDAARRYAEIAPDAEHALHMPSHIFVQLGLWRDVVASNERAWAASRAEVAARNLSNADLSFHTLEWLQYGYLQLGQYAASRGTIESARQALAGIDLRNALHADARYTVGKLEFQHAANTGEWTGDVCRERSDRSLAPDVTSEREQSFLVMHAYQNTIAAVMCGRGADTIESVRARLAKLPASDVAARGLKTALLHAELLTYIRDNAARDLDALLADPASPSSPPIGPPTTLRTEELLGQARLKAGKTREAVAAYERALQLTPHRTAALLGLARARHAAGDRAGAADAYRRLLDNWRSADTTLPALQEAKEGAALR